MKRFLLTATALMISAAIALYGQTTIRYVDANATAGSNNGASWADAYTNFQTAINAAASGDSVFVAAGTYTPASSGSYFSMKQGVKILGGYPSGGGARDWTANITILHGNNNTVVYNYKNGLTAAAVLDGFTITGGNGSSAGGMFNTNSSPTITNCIFLNNTSSNYGGGMENVTSSPTITNCTFSGNSAGDNEGGGMENESSSSPTITNCTFVNNTATYFGGAMGNNASSPTIINCTFANNTAPYGGGGGIFSQSSSFPTITNTIFWGNTSTYGSNPDILTATTNSSLSITYSYTQTAQGGTSNIHSTANPFVNSATPAGADGVFGTADDGLELVLGSSAINAGNNAALPSNDTLDLAGYPRTREDIIDMGAYEYQGAALPVTLNSFSGTLQNGAAQLQWNTGVENNLNHFEIEKSSVIPTNGGISEIFPDGQNDGSFATVATINAKGSNSSYSANIPQTEATAYYRLKMVNNDGSATYSNIVTLSQSNNSNTIIYPNPANDYINIKVANAGSIGIYDASGKLMKTQNVQTGVNSIDVSALSAGVYYVDVNGTKAKFVKQ